MTDWQVESTGKAEGQFKISAITPRPENASEFIVIDDDDTLIISAAGWWAARNIVMEFDVPTHPLGHIACADWGYTPDRTLKSVRMTSIAVFRATVEAWVRDHAITRLTHQIAAIRKGKIFLLPWPPPNRSLKSDPSWCVNQWYGENGCRAWLAFFDAQLIALQKIAAELSPQLTLIPYPYTDGIADGFMDASLCDQDPFHGNEEYGKRIIDLTATFI